MLTYLQFGDTYQANDLLEDPQSGDTYVVGQPFPRASKWAWALGQKGTRRTPLRAGDVVIFEDLPYKPRRWTADQS